MNNVKSECVLDKTPIEGKPLISKVVSLFSIVCILFGCLATSSCTRKDYKDGYREGYSEGLGDGESIGYRKGTMKLVEESFLPSMGGAICLGLFVIIFWVTIKLFWKPVGDFVREALRDLYEGKLAAMEVKAKLRAAQRQLRLAKTEAQQVYWQEAFSNYEHLEKANRGERRDEKVQEELGKLLMSDIESEDLEQRETLTQPYSGAIEYFDPDDFHRTQTNSQSTKKGKVEADLGFSLGKSWTLHANNNQ